ncbi:MAG: CbiX/SirB N-terminal domain-containing protein [Deltaproteobacteria bacterium]|nr:CbiX/SirB N-terminal domain-containing protein [Deltaproteobacteria bacterium]
MKNAVVLVGHGGIPKDYSPEKVSRLKMLESQRQRTATPMTEEERVLDEEIRTWPRTLKNDPFCFGTQAIAKHLQPKLADTKLVVAYNEFCGPSIEQAVSELVGQKFTHITLLSTMLTPGGVHSEFEIPEIVEDLQKKYPQIELHYPWPFNLDKVAGFLADCAS